jgi:pyruvate/2-oxoglutarate/acetoin dehydrogenase E1 component
MPDVQQLSYGGAINAGLRRVLTDVPETLLYGEDVGKPGGVFGISRGLARSFGDRVFDTPISESAILGSALGAAMLGRRPIVEIMWADFALVALDQIVNQIANARYISRGEVAAPLVIRTQQGTGPGACAQHSQCLEAFFLHTPGLRVVMPSMPQDAFDAIVTATYCDDPVLVVENRNLYSGDKADVVVDGPVLPLGGSVHRRTGDDVTVLSWGSMTRLAEAAADAVAAQGVGVDVIEARWLNPFELSGLLSSLRRTGRLVVVHEANVTGGFGAEILAQVAESGVALKSAPVRVGLPDVRMPAAPALANAAIPTADRIREAILRVLGESSSYSPVSHEQGVHV